MAEFGTRGPQEQCSARRAIIVAIIGVTGSVVGWWWHRAADFTPDMRIAVSARTRSDASDVMRPAQGPSVTPTSTIDANPPMPTPEGGPTAEIYGLAVLDVVGGRSEDCPGCNRHVSRYDIDAARLRTLGPMTFRVRDAGGHVLAVATTDAANAAAFGVPRLPAGSGYTLELLVPSAGLALCPYSPPVRWIPAERVDTPWAETFVLWDGCPPIAAGATAAPYPTATLRLPSTTSPPPTTPSPSPTDTEAATLAPSPTLDHRATPTHTATMRPSATPTPEATLSPTAPILPSATPTPSPTITAWAVGEPTPLSLPTAMTIAGRDLRADTSTIRREDDPEEVNGCAEFVALHDGAYLAACQSVVQWLSRRSPAAPLRAASEVRAEDLGGWNVTRLLPTTSRMFVHSFDGRVRELVPGPNGPRTFDTDLWGAQAYVLGGALATIQSYPNWFGELFQLVTMDPETLDKIGEVGIPRPLPQVPPIIDDTEPYLYIMTYGPGLVVYDLTNSATPRTVRSGEHLTAPHIEGNPFYAHDGLAYFSENEMVGPTAVRWWAAVYDLTVTPPVFVRRIELSAGLPVRLPVRPEVQHMHIAGDVLFASPGGGWLARIDIRDPDRPVALPPMAFAGNVLRFANVGAEVAVVVDRSQLNVVRPVPAGDPGVEAVWSPWWPPDVSGPMQVVGDHLLVGQKLPVTDLLHFDHEVIDVRDAAAPGRTGRLRTNGPPEFADVAGTLFALADGGREVQGYTRTVDGSPRVIAKWCVPDGPCPPAADAPPLASLAAHDTTLYAQLADGTLLALDASDLRQVREVGRWRIEGLAAGHMLVAGARLVVLPKKAPPFVLDISRPEAPRPIGSLAGLPTGIQHAAAIGSQVAFAQGDRLYVTALEDAAGPRVVAHLTFPAALQMLAADSDRWYTQEGPTLWVLAAVADQAPDVVGRLRLRSGGWLTGVHDGVVYNGSILNGGLDVLTNVRPDDGSTAVPTPSPTVAATPSETPAPTPSRTSASTPLWTPSPTRTPTPDPMTAPKFVLRLPLVLRPRVR